MMFYIDLSMKEYKNVAMHKSKASMRWWMYAAYLILDLKDADGLLRKG